MAGGASGVGSPVGELLVGEELVVPEEVEESEEVEEPEEDEPEDVGSLAELVEELVLPVPSPPFACACSPSVAKSSSPQSIRMRNRTIIGIHLLVLYIVKTSFLESVGTCPLLQCMRTSLGVEQKNCHRAKNLVAEIDKSFIRLAVQTQVLPPLRTLPGSRIL